MNSKGIALRKRRVAAVAIGGLTAAAVVLGGAFAPMAAVALETDNSEAEGRLITGSTAVVDLNAVADLAGAYSADPSAPGAVNHPLSLEVLNSLGIDLGDGLQLFGENGIVGLGALGQYANTAEGVVPLASAGLVNADGSIAVGSGDPTENAYVDLGPLLAGAGLDALLDDARLELGAISALATHDAAGEPVGDYQIANGTLLLTSPTLAGLSAALVGTLGQISDPINGLAGTGGVIDTTINPLLDPLVETLNTLLLGVGSIDDLGVTATVDLDLEAAVESVLSEPLTSDDSVLTIDLSTGTVSVDLARLVADTQGGDYDGTLNGLPVNTELLDPDLVQAALDGAIGSTLDQIPALLVNVVTDALHAADVNIAITGEIDSLLGSIGTVDIQLSGTLGDFIGAEGSTAPVVNTDGTTIIGLPVGTLLTPILSAVTGTILPALVTPLSEAITDEGTLDTIFRPVVEAANTVLQPVFGLVTNNLLSLTANVQEEPGDFVEGTAFDEGSFTQRALQLTLLPAAATPLLQLSLASATVRAVPAAVATIDAASTVPAGGNLAVTGADWPASTTVTLQLTDPTGAPVGEPITVDTDANGAFTTTYPVPADTEPGTGFTITGTAGDVTAEDTVEVTAADPGDVNTNAAASASASADATADGDPSAQAAAEAAALADATSAATAAANADATAAAEAAATTDASTAASADSTTDVNAQAAVAAQAAAQADASDDVEAAATATADSNSAVAAQAAATADSSTDASSEASTNANAAASASASANADATTDAVADVAAQAAAYADATAEATAAADSTAQAAASAAATATSSATATSDATSAANANAAVAAQAAALADASSDTAAEGSAAVNGNASSASEAAAIANSSTDASVAATADADADADPAAAAEVNTNATASAAASAQADADNDAAAQAAAVAAALADASTAADAAATPDAEAAAASAATATATSAASADATTDANASAAVAAQAAAQADNSASTTADATAAAEADTAAAAAVAATATSSNDASATAAADAVGSTTATATADADADPSAAAEVNTNATASAAASAQADADNAAAAQAAAVAAALADASTAADAAADPNAEAAAAAAATADVTADASVDATSEANAAAAVAAQASAQADNSASAAADTSAAATADADAAAAASAASTANSSASASANAAADASAAATADPAAAATATATASANTAATASANANANAAASGSADANPGGLAGTGSDVPFGWIALGALLLMLGLGTALVARSRRAVAAAE